MLNRSIKTLMYIIKRDGEYLIGVEPNEHYSRTGTAPAMGARHCFHEYVTVWGCEPRPTEPLTAASNLKVLFEEYRWEERDPKNIEIIPIWK